MLDSFDSLLVFFSCVLGDLLLSFGAGENETVSQSIGARFFADAVSDIHRFVCDSLRCFLFCLLSILMFDLQP